MFRVFSWRRLAWLLVPVLALAGLAALLIAGRVTRVVDVAPADGAADVPITTALRLEFSRTMDPASVEASFRLEPAVAGRWLWAGRVATFQPQGALSPATDYTVRLETGALDARGRPLRAGQIWQFRTRAPQMLYLGRTAPDSDVRQLFLAPLDGSAPRTLTDQVWGVWDYAVHPQGEAIVYSVLRGDGGSDLWRMDRDGSNQRLLLACPGAACMNPAWSPDGRWIAYEQRTIWRDGPNLDPQASRLWLIDPETGKARPLFDYDVPLHSPVWSPDGGRLAYVSPVLPGVEVYDLEAEELLQFDNEWGTAPSWSPEGRQLVLPDLLLIESDDSTDASASTGVTATAEHEEYLAVRLVRIDLDSGQMLDISGDDDLLKDSAPAWSPNGGWIAVARQYLDEARWTPGRQMWLTRPDASEVYNLLSEPMGDFFAFVWRPDGGSLAYLRSDLSEGPQLVPDVSVWYFDFAAGEPVRVAEGGVLPRWLP